MNDLGEAITVHCATVGGNPVAIGSHIRYRRHLELARAARALAEAFQRDHETDVAERTVRLLIRFADVTTHWPVVHTEKLQSGFIRYTLTPKGPFADGMYGKWGGVFADEIPQDLVFAYDLVYESPVWDDLSRECGCDLRRRVESELLRPALRLALTVHGDLTGTPQTLSPRFYQRMIHLGRVLNDPDVIHQAVHFLQNMIRTSDHADDRHSQAATTDHGVVTEDVGIAARALTGYADPPGYVDQRYGISIGSAKDPLGIPHSPETMEGRVFHGLP